MTQEEKSIEIPFGAYDSEFIRDEYLIPDGYEVRIEGNKVIIEKIQKEEELTEFEKEVKHFMCYCCEDVFVEDVPKYLKEISTKLLDLARKELLKDLPKWKDVSGKNGAGTKDYEIVGYYLVKGNYAIYLEDLEKLPKEE